MAPSSPTSPRTGRPLTVQLSLSPPDGTTRYVDQVVEGAPTDVAFRFFSWRAALFGGYDVFHVHWPEFLVRDPQPVKAFLQRLSLRVLLLLLRVRRVPIVRTLHNLRPHESGHVAETRVLDALDRRTAAFIKLNPTTPLPPSASNSAEVVTIPHGHYRGRFRSDAQPVPGRILHFGLIRRYKGVETLLGVFRSLEDPGLQLRIVGRPSDGLGEVIEREQAYDARVSSVLRFVQDAELVDEVGHAELVVLPYREMHNSGAILVALSLNRPVLVPSSPANAVLAEEVGPGWVHQYEGELTTEILGGTLDDLRARPRTEPPRLDGRDWMTIGAATSGVYRRALARSRPARADAAALEPVR
ncbi:glycosyltransferase [Glaciibacter sp. 2TAF33]|uniref:glycosyltransferase n=1 Tax=Glaciibacter sp. 2TAF33 TaxID=3233015 RepID=UPI003F93E209